MAPSWLPGSAAADAFADSERIGLGGWFTLSDQDPPQAGFWYSLNLDTSMFPQEWNMHTAPQRNIACYELLAQIIMLAYRGRFRSGTSQLVQCKAWSDNTPTEAVANKLFTTNAPLCFFLQLLAAWSSRMGVRVSVGHIPGVENTLADGLSRGREDIVAQFDPRRQLHVNIGDIIACRCMPILMPQDGRVSRVLETLFARLASSQEHVGRGDGQGS